MKEFKAIVWVHPKNGGDDRENDLVIYAENKQNAEILIRNCLKRRSAIIDDFKIVSEKEIKQVQKQKNTDLDEAKEKLKKYALNHHLVTEKKLSKMTNLQLFNLVRNAVQYK